ncbi:MAG: hypothetical protein AB1521_17560 [Bacteroidota bacterium]
MEKKFSLLLVVIIVVITNSCKDNGTGPEEKKSVRDYTWTADTLTRGGSIQTLMRSIWGSSANNIYICGHNDDAYGKIWHYDGNEWEYIDSTQNIRQQFGGASYQAVNGTDASNVWVVGYSGTTYQGKDYYIPFILEYNGTSWKKHQVNTKSAVYSVYAVSANDVWACGADGIVYHYDGSSWEIDTIEVSTSEGDQYNLYSITKSNSVTYTQAAVIENNSPRRRYYLFEKRDENWSKVDSFTIDSQNSQWKWGANHLYNTSFGKLYAVGFGIYERDGSNWITILPQEFASFRGFRDKGSSNMIACGDGGSAYHYDGNNWQEINALHGKDLLYTGVWMEENEAFVIANDLSGYPQTTIVFHGK